MHRKHVKDRLLSLVVVLEREGPDRAQQAISEFLTELDNEPPGVFPKYFVLKPDDKGPYGAASRAAMNRYAQMIDGANDQLAEDLREWSEHLSIKHNLAEDQS